MAALGTTVGVATLVVVGGAEPAAAKGANMFTVADRHEPGDTATLIGYTTGGRIGDPEDEGPFHAYLMVEAGSWPHYEEVMGGEETTLYDADDIPLGPVEMTETEAWGQPAVRASVTFQLPADLAPGEYNVLVCGGPCTSTGPGDLGSGYIAVGVDPFYRLERMWPPEEPAVSQLADDDLLLDAQGYLTEVADLRAEAAADRDAADHDGAADTATARRTATGDETAGASSPRHDRDDETDVAGIVPWLLGAVLLGAVGVTTTVWRARRHGAVATATSSSTAVDGGGGGDDDEAVGRGPGA